MEGLGGRQFVIDHMFDQMEVGSNLHSVCTQNEPLSLTEPRGALSVKSGNKNAYLTGP